MSDLVLSGIVLELHVPSFEPAIDFYSQFGFEVAWKREGADGYMVMKAGRNILNFFGGNEQVYRHPHFERFPASTPRGYAVEIVVPVDKVSSIYEAIVELEKKGELIGRVVEELKLKPWGKYDFRMEDPFGFYVRICEPDNWLVP